MPVLGIAVFERGHRLADPEALGQHLAQRRRLRQITSLLDQDGEVAKGQVAVDALVEAAELFRTLR